MKKITKYLKQRFQNSCSKRSEKFSDKFSYTEIHFYFKNKKIIHYFDSESLRILFKNYFSLDYDILSKKISLFRNKIEDNIEFYNFPKLNNSFYIGGHIEIKYELNTFLLNKPNSISFNYSGYSFCLFCNDNVSHYNETDYGYKTFIFSLNKISLLMNSTLDKFIIYQTKKLFNNVFGYSDQINIENFKDYLNLVKIKEY